MELDKSTPISDEQRRLAASKKLTLEPVHADLSPDDISDSEIASRHLVEPAIGNATNDTEQNGTLIRPTPSSDIPTPTTSWTPLTRVIVALLGTGLAITAGVVFFTR